VVVARCTVLGCDEQFSSIPARRKHYREVHKDPNLLHVCLKCDKTFDDAKRFREHSRSHKNPFTCPTCGKVLTTRYNLNCHRQSQHGLPTGADPKHGLPEGADPEHGLPRGPNPDKKRKKVLELFELLKGKANCRPAAWEKLVQLVERSGQKELGMEVFEEVLERFPSWGDVWHRYAKFAGTDESLSIFKSVRCAMLACIFYSGFL
jgi:hypothetical protein